jgi:hypothetical protein
LFIENSYIPVITIVTSVTNGFIEKLIHLIFCWYVKLKLPRVVSWKAQTKKRNQDGDVRASGGECVVGQRPLWAVLLHYNNSSFYIIHHNDSHRICPSLVQLSEESTLDLPLSVKTCKHRFLKNLAAFFG